MYKRQLKDRYTIIMVTHNMQQAARISDKTAFFLLGEMVEFGETDQIFSVPKDTRTAVSYTHLDVYKRQVHSFIKDIARDFLPLI